MITRWLGLQKRLRCFYFKKVMTNWKMDMWTRNGENKKIITVHKHFSVACPIHRHLRLTHTSLVARGLYMLSPSLCTNQLLTKPINFKVTMSNFQFLWIVAPPLDKGGSDTSAYCWKDLCLCVRQAELGVTLEMRVFVLETSERETAGWMAMR